MSLQDFFQAECSKCFKPLGVLDPNEFYWLYVMGDGAMLCFDCEPLGAMSKPEIFWNMLPGDRFRLGDTILVREEHFLVLETRAHEYAHDTRARACLSSSTYHNRTLENRAVGTDGVEYDICPTCKGDAHLFDNLIKDACPTCGGQGLIPIAIFIPRWLLDNGGIDV